MKRLFVIVATLVVVLFETSAYAESNPLLTVFEGLKVGIDVETAEEAVRAYGKHITGGLYLTQPSTKSSIAHTRVSWIWIDPDYKCNGCIAPTARLEITYVVSSLAYKNRRILEIVYKYSFLELEKILKK